MNPTAHPSSTSWLESYRGTVYRWEVDNVDHFTVAFYFSRLQDATDTLLHAIGLDAVMGPGAGRAAVTVDCDVRYLRELRIGDILHVRSGVIGADERGLRLAHEIVDSSDDTVCTRVEQGLALVDLASRARQALTPPQRAAALAHRVDWEPLAPAAPGPPAPAGDRGFIESARDVIKPAEVDVHGEAGLAAYIHRFSASNCHILAAFGMTPAYSRDQARGFSTFEFRLRLPGTLRAGDLVRVRTGLLHVGNSSIRMLHRMTNGRTGEEVATLEQAGVHLDLDARRPAPLPPPLRERAQPLLAPR